MKTKFLLQIIIILLIGCSENQSITSKILESNNWFDKFGNEYKFKNGNIETKPYLGQIWWGNGKFRIINNSFVLTCEQDSTEKNISEIISIKDDKIIFKNPIEICQSSISKDERKKQFEIYKSLEQIRDKEEKISSLVFKVRPAFLFGGIRNFNLDKDKKVKIGFKSEESIDTTFFINDTLLNEIENLIQILPLEDYDNKYEFAIIDGADFEIELVTNRVSKNINCKGMLPKGLNNLYQYINFKLK